MSADKHNTPVAAPQAVVPENFSISELRNAVEGRVITPEDQEYDKARTVFYGDIERRPAAIVRVASANDVSRVILFAKENGLELAVRGGGHSAAGYGISHGGIVIDTSALKGLDIDVVNRTAWAQSGLTAGEYTEAAGQLGLATGFGDSGSVGIAGITLGGGVGFFARKYGMTIDDLLAVEIVTADGKILHVDDESHPDLFWALRGGGGNFGVVTRLKFRLHEVDQVVGGMLILPATPELLRDFLAEADAAPEELTGMVNVMVAPPMPFVPEEHHGKLILMALMVYSGDLDAADQVFAPFRALATPLTDTLRKLSYPEMYEPEPEDYHPMAIGHTLFMDEVDQDVANFVFEKVTTGTAMMSLAHFRVLGGAMARVPAEATAFAHRNRKIMANVVALYMNPDEKATHEAWVKDFAKGLQQGEAGAYVNFLADEGAERVREAYPGATWDRLAAVKAQYDPTNLFRLNQNIQPVAEGSR